MKKSKVLIPAMALLLFSTAASITGTVAWFTSTRTFTTSAGNFQVAKLDGSLECDLTALVGCTINDNGTDHESVNVPSTNVIGDASFDHTTQKLYTDNPSTGGFSTLDTMTGSDGNFVPGTASKWLYNTVSGTSYYFAIAWNMQFKYTVIAETQDINIFFDYKNSTLEKTDGAAHASGNDTSKGFRIALLGPGATIIWSELHDGVAHSPVAPSYAELTDTKTYVSGELSSNTSAYVAGDHFIDATEKAAAYTRVVDGGALTGRKDYLGTIENDGPGVKNIMVTCVAWFEGTSLNVVDATSMAKMSASMQFYATMAAA
jgi:hypothetical protein